MLNIERILGTIPAETIKRFLNHNISDEVGEKITPQLARRLIHDYNNKQHTLSPELIALMGTPKVYDALFIYSSLGPHSIRAENRKRGDRKKRWRGKRGAH